MIVLKVGPWFRSLDTVIGSSEVKKGSEKLLLFKFSYREEV